MYRLVLEAVGGVLPLKGAGIIKPLSNGSIGHDHEISHLSTCLKIALCPVSCSEQIQSWRRCWRYFCHLNFPSFSIVSPYSPIIFLQYWFLWMLSLILCRPSMPLDARLKYCQSLQTGTSWHAGYQELAKHMNDSTDWITYWACNLVQPRNKNSNRQKQKPVSTPVDMSWHVLTCLDMSWPPQEFVPFELLAQHWDRSLALTGAKALRDTWQTSKFLREGFFGTLFSSNS